MMNTAFAKNILNTSIINLLGDKLVGEASRLVVAEACIQALDIESTQGQAYEISSVKVPMLLT
jgi:chemotaxis receptor (MCP) glutamine deamidase CheD